MNYLSPRCLFPVLAFYICFIPSERVPAQISKPEKPHRGGVRCDEVEEVSLAECTVLLSPPRGLKFILSHPPQYLASNGLHLFRRLMRCTLAPGQSVTRAQKFMNRQSLCECADALRPFRAQSSCNVQFFIVQPRLQLVLRFQGTVGLLSRSLGPP